LKENTVIEAEIILTIAMMIDICIRIIAEREVIYNINVSIFSKTTGMLLI
jgi:hypothetical protein